MREAHIDTGSNNRCHRLSGAYIKVEVNVEGTSLRQLQKKKNREKSSRISSKEG